MITYERYIPGEVKTYYHPTRYCYVTAVVWNLGAKPIVVRRDDYAAQMRPEPLPGTTSRGVIKEQYGGQPLIAVQAENALAERGEPMTVDEIAQAIDKHPAAVSRVLLQNSMFKRMGLCGTGQSIRALWGLKNMAELTEPVTLQDIIADVLRKHGALEVSRIVAMTGRKRTTVSATLRGCSRFCRAGKRENGGNPATLWALADQENGGHD